MNGKESRSTEYIRGWPSIDDAKHYRYEQRSLCFHFGGVEKNKKSEETRSEKYREKEEKKKKEIGNGETRG